MSRRFYNLPLSEPKDYYLKYDLQSDFLDSSGNGNNGIVAGALPTLTTKDGKECVYFDGSKSFKTSSPITVNNQFTICFEIWTTQTNTAIISELTVNYNNNSGFAVITGAFNKGVEFSLSYMSPKDYSQTNGQLVAVGSWKKVALTFDSTLISNKGTFYLDGAKINLVSTGPSITTFFASNILFFGRRAGTSLGFVGYLRNYKIFSRAISKNEAIALTK